MRLTRGRRDINNRVGPIQPLRKATQTNTVQTKRRGNPRLFAMLNSRLMARCKTYFFAGLAGVAGVAGVAFMASPLASFAALASAFALAFASFFAAASAAFLAFASALALALASFFAAASAFFSSLVIAFGASALAGAGAAFGASAFAGAVGAALGASFDMLSAAVAVRVAPAKPTAIRVTNSLFMWFSPLVNPVIRMCLITHGRAGS